MNPKIKEADSYLAEIERSAKKLEGYISAQNMLGLIAAARAALALCDEEPTVPMAIAHELWDFNSESGEWPEYAEGFKRIIAKHMPGYKVV